MLKLFINLFISLASFGLSGNEVKELYIQNQDAELFCRIAGEGNPVIVTYGGPGLTQDYLLPELYKLAKNHLVIFYDHRGSGKSTGAVNAETITMDNYISDIEAIRTAFNLEKFSLFGHDWGAFLAMHYAFSHPERLNKLILSNPLPASSDDYALYAKEWFLRVAPYVNELTEIHQSEGFANFDPDTFERMHRIYLRTYCYYSEDAERLDIRGSSSATVKNGAKIYDYFHIIFEGEYNLFPQLANIPTPTLVIHGDYDPIPAETAQRIYESIPHSEYILMKNCGRFPHIENPKFYLYFIEEFLKKNQE